MSTWDVGIRHPLTLLAAATFVGAYAFRAIKKRDTYKLPPGPQGVPVFGNLFQLSMTPWKEFEVWKNDFGPLVYITAAGQGMLILNTHKAAADLLDRRGHIYSDRPRWIVASEIFSGGMMVVFSRYGDLWRRMRRAAHEALNKRRAAEYYPIQTKEAIILTSGLLKNPLKWENELRRTSASTMLSFLYDLPTILSPTDPTVEKINEFTGYLARAASPGSYFVEFFPWMKYLPRCISRWRREAEAGFQEFSKVFGDMFGEVENRIKQGCERPSFAGSLIREHKRHGLNQTEAAWLAATMYAAGSETTGTAMTWFILAMIAHPDVQKKCQEELDSVVGRSRMPTFEDRDHLPYIQATIRELIRWRTTTPVGLQHVSMEDDWYEGYFIPKGTMCLANIWSLNRDRAVYGEDADEFNPARFIDEKGQLCPPLPDTKEEGHVSFGYGPRICLGRYIARNSLFINIASILWAANIVPTEDKFGNAIVPDTLETLNAGVVACPLPFECSISPRFPEATMVVSQTREMA